MNSALILIPTLLLFFAGIILVIFVFKLFRQKRKLLGTVLLIISLSLLIPSIVFIVTATMVTMIILNN